MFCDIVKYNESVSITFYSESKYQNIPHNKYNKGPRCPILIDI